MSNKSKVTPSKNTWSLYFGAICFALMVFFILDFGLAQICKFNMCQNLLHRQHKEKFRINDKVFHHSLEPNVSVIEKWGEKVYPLYTNSLGFKDLQIRHIPKETDAYRILFLGDSFTEGIGLNFEYSFVGQIQKALAKDGVDVLNAAVSSYSPAIYFSKTRNLLEQDKVRFDHVVVFIDMSDIMDEALWYNVGDDGIVHTVNPEEDHLFKKAFNRDFSNWLKKNSLITKFVYRLRDWWNYQAKKKLLSENNKKAFLSNNQKNSIPKEIINTRETQWCFKNKFWKEWAQEGVKKAKKNMTRLNQLLKKRSIKLTIGIYPWPANIYYKDYPSRHSIIWNDWASNAGVDILDLFPKFINGKNPRKVIIKNFFPGDVHWNRTGHETVARAFLDYYYETIHLAH